MTGNHWQNTVLLAVLPVTIKFLQYMMANIENDLESLTLTQLPQEKYFEMKCPSIHAPPVSSILRATRTWDAKF